MSLTGMLEWLQHRPFSVNIAESTWAFPGLETLHVLAISIVVGSVALMDLRLLGVGSQRPISQVIEGSWKWTWTAFAVAVMAGGLLFCSKAVTYYQNLPFRLKMACLALAGLNMIVFHAVTARGMTQWERGAPPTAARLAGGLSITLWIIIVASGRWIGFTY
jgi:hypothetical protein